MRASSRRSRRPRDSATASSSSPRAPTCRSAGCPPSAGEPVAELLTDAGLLPSRRARARAQRPREPARRPASRGARRDRRDRRGARPRALRRRRPGGAAGPLPVRGRRRQRPGARRARRRRAGRRARRRRVRARRSTAHATSIRVSPRRRRRRSPSRAARAFLELAAGSGGAVAHRATSHGGAAAIARAARRPALARRAGRRAATRAARARDRRQNDGRVAVTALPPLARLDPDSIEALRALARARRRRAAPLALAHADAARRRRAPTREALAGALAEAGLVRLAGLGLDGPLGLRRDGRVLARRCSTCAPSRDTRAAVRDGSSPSEHWSGCERRCGQPRGRRAQHRRAGSRRDRLHPRRRRDLPPLVRDDPQRGRARRARARRSRPSSCA